ncbi:hypothetical protein [Mycolicibacterium austroafricanum]|uniref:hypothetical protein n=1 Tax=Mycolicibacterium austroafricanum TaxID=39687 RepID=UPI001F186887|nr:hypothetical protein [Mycolicibacterium austroafricanum]
MTELHPRALDSTTPKSDCGRHVGRVGALELTLVVGLAVTAVPVSSPETPALQPAIRLVTADVTADVTRAAPPTPRVADPHPAYDTSVPAAVASQPCVESVVSDGAVRDDTPEEVEGTSGPDSVSVASHAVVHPAPTIFGGRANSRDTGRTTSASVGLTPVTLVSPTGAFLGLIGPGGLLIGTGVLLPGQNGGWLIGNGADGAPGQNGGDAGLFGDGGNATTTTGAAYAGNGGPGGGGGPGNRGGDGGSGGTGTSRNGSDGPDGADG